MNELLQQFLIESREMAEHASDDLVALEQSPQDPELLDAVLRAMHTLKGSAGIVEFLEMEQAMHAAEDALGAARALRRNPDRAAISQGLACMDQVLEWLVVIERTGELPRVSGIAQSAGRIEADSAVHAPASRAWEIQLPDEVREVLTTQRAIVEDATSPLGHLASAALTASNVLHFLGQDAHASHLAQLATAGRPDDLRAALREELTGLLGGSTGATPASPRQIENLPRTLRVPAERIDTLVRLTGELTVARNALSHLSRLASAQGNPLASQLKDQQATFEQLTGELQRSVLTLRVMPLRAVFQRFPRALREISEELGKPIQLKTTGEDTEADKAIVESLFEPLLHVVRNAADHGVENLELRAQRGKPPTATIELRAARQGDLVVIEVADDGAGMDVEAIRKVALQRGLITQEALESLTEEEVIELVFVQGFSTAATLSHLSGRGVGMDVVRTAIERLGGRVALQSQAGRGTTVRFMLPFSVMVTTVMSVQAGGQMFGVPIDHVVEVIRVPRGALSPVGAARAVVIRDQTLPVVDLSQMLGERGPSHESPEATIVITNLSGERCGLEIDSVGGQLDVILKPLDGLLADTPGISGTTLLGDGRVLLVLDLGQMLQ